MPYIFVKSSFDDLNKKTGADFPIVNLENITNPCFNDAALCKDSPNW